jgi:uncharacterized integral membrane protein
MSNNQNTTPSQTPSTQNQMSLGQKIRWVFIAILAIVLLIFTIQNANPVKVEFLNIDMEISLILIIGASMLLGGMLGLLVFRSKRRQ